MSGIYGPGPLYSRRMGIIGPQIAIAFSAQGGRADQGPAALLRGAREDGLEEHDGQPAVQGQSRPRSVLQRPGQAALMMITSLGRKVSSRPGIT